MKLRKIVRIYDRIKRQAAGAFEAGDLGLSLSRISTACELGYQFNWIYADDELEELTARIAERLLPQPGEYVPRPGRVVFFDSFAWANRGLTQQYIRALMSRGVELLFVYDGSNPASTVAVADEIGAYPKGEFYAVDTTLPQTEQILALREKIAGFAPEKAFIHITPWDAVAVAVWHLLPATARYWVNLTDHAFWLGARCLDYSLEFRPYGCTVSEERRGLSPGQLLTAPYYPILDCQPFAGLPPGVTPQNIVVFTGGNFYKMYGRGQLFLRLLERLAGLDERVVVLVAGGGDSKPLRRFVKRRKLEGRILLIGSRPDINHVFAHSDIYLSTYPITGGLMAQFAAANRKPILAYSDPGRACNSVSSLLVWGDGPLEEVTSATVEAFTERARRLVADPEFRRSEGEKAHAHLITPAEFAERLFRLTNENRDDRPSEKVRIDYRDFTSVYLEIQKRYINVAGELLWRTYGWRAAAMAPGATVRHIFAAIRRKFAIFT